MSKNYPVEKSIAYFPGTILIDFDLCNEGIFRDQVTGFFGPLNETAGPGIKILFISHIKELTGILNPVEVKMKNGIPFGVKYSLTREKVGLFTSVVTPRALQSA